MTVRWWGELGLSSLFTRLDFCSSNLFVLFVSYPYTGSCPIEIMHLNSEKVVMDLNKKDERE